MQMGASTTPNTTVRLFGRLAAIALLAITAAMMAFAFASLVVPGAERIPDRPDLVSALIFFTIFLAFPAVGIVVTWKRPEHPVGWLFLLVGITLIQSVFATEYAGRAYFGGQPLPAADVVAWVGGWGWYAAGGVGLPLAIALFPTGSFPGSRWRMAFRVMTVAVVVQIAFYMIVPGEMTGWQGRVRNPFGVEGPVGELAATVASLETASLLAMAALSLGALGTRLRRSTGPERQQLKWLLFPVAVFLTGIVAATATAPSGEAQDSVNTLAWTVALVGLAGVPVASGIAILRYRLFDIDVVIRRTLVYSLVIAVLAATYVALVLVMQSALSGVTGGGPLPVAVSTLAIAALFGPVQRRVRRFVDRRFYRSRYDAQRTVDAFSTRLRDEVELAAVGKTLVKVASDAVRPASAVVWLRAR